MDENTIICRCSDVTLKDIRDLIAQGGVMPVAREGSSRGKRVEPH